jgi:hypothetical protein
MDPGQTSGKRGDEMSEKESAAGPGEEAGELFPAIHHVFQ